MLFSHLEIACREIYNCSASSNCVRHADNRKCFSDLDIFIKVTPLFKCNLYVLTIESDLMYVYVKKGVVQMNNKFNYVIRGIFLTVILLVLFPNLKSTAVEKKSRNLDVGVSYTMPSLLFVKGLTYPDEVWDVGKQGKVKMSASVGKGNFTYSKYIMKGKKTYKYYFHNEGNGSIDIQIKNRYSHAIYKSINLAKGAVAEGSFSAGNKDTPLYVQFYSNKDYVFSGYLS